MSENKDYVSRSDELGNIHIAEEVLAAVAASAAMEVQGVCGLSGNSSSDLTEVMNKKTLSKGVHIHMDAEEKVVVELSVMISYGNTIPEVGKNVQDSIKTALESMTGLEVAAVNVSVTGIVFPPRQQ